MLLPLVLCALLALPSAPLRSDSSAPVLTVRLARGLASAREVDVECDGDTRVSLDGAPVAPSAGVWRVSAGPEGIVLRSPARSTPSAGSRCTFDPGDSAGMLGVARSGAKPTRYRGRIEIQASAGSALLVLNRVDIESYLRGVVPSEMPPSAPPAALQAQAVCARTYALKLRQTGKYRAKGYDLDDTTLCQSYGGASAEKPSTDEAVRRTAGQVLLYGGALVWADYCDDCGGATAPGDGPDDFPPSVSDQTEEGEDLCAAAPHHFWSLTLPASEIARRLGTTAQGLGPIASIEVIERDETGRVVLASIVGQDAERTIKGAAMRAALGYEALRSTRFGVVRNDDGSFTFTGKGNGHGRGLCQWGTMALAKPPRSLTCAQILDHYFPGAVLGEAPPGLADPPPNRTLPSRSRPARSARSRTPQTVRTPGSP